MQIRALKKSRVVHGITAYGNQNSFTNLKSILENGFEGRSLENAFKYDNSVRAFGFARKSIGTDSTETKGDKYSLEFHNPEQIVTQTTEANTLTVKNATPNQIKRINILLSTMEENEIERKKRFYNENLKQYKIPINFITPKPRWVGIYYNQLEPERQHPFGTQDYDYLEYNFITSNNKDKLYKTKDLVGVRKLPREWADVLNNIPNNKDSRQLSGVIGYIIRGKTATSMAYYPKGTDYLKDPRSPPPETAPGLGYYLESLAVKHLKDKLGVTHISTSTEPSGARRAQLGKVGLPIKTVVPIKDWLEGLGKGIKTRRKIN